MTNVATWSYDECGNSLANIIHGWVKPNTLGVLADTLVNMFSLVITAIGDHGHDDDDHDDIIDKSWSANITWYV